MWRSSCVTPVGSSIYYTERFSPSPTLRGTKNLNGNGPNPFFFLGPKTWSESILWQRFCFGMVSATSLSSSMRGRYKNKIAEWKWLPIFQNKRSRHATADELELYSSTTFLTGKRRHQPIYVEVLLFLFTHCGRMNTSTARQRAELQTDTAPMLFAGCQHSKASNSLHCSIRSKVEVNFADVCGSILVGLPGSRASSSAGADFTTC